MALTQRNIEIDSEAWIRLKAEAAKRHKNVRSLAGEVVSDYLVKLGGPLAGGGMRAIIIAAGTSPRMMELTKDRPKCMLPVGTKTILERQIETLRACGINDISVVKGYNRKAINYPGVKYFYNPDFRRTGTLASLMCAESEMEGGFIALYSDIIFDGSVVERLLEEDRGISIVVDTAWSSRYLARFQHPIEEAEKVVVKKGKVAAIAKSLNPNEASGEFIGMVKFRGDAVSVLKENYARFKKIPEKPFHTSPSLEAAGVIDMIQEIIDQNHAVSGVGISGGWMEIDTTEDYQNACRILKVRTR